MIIGLAIIALALIGAARVVTLSIRYSRRGLARVGHLLTRLDTSDPIGAMVARHVAAANTAIAARKVKP